MIIHFLKIWFNITKYYFFPKDSSISLIKYFIYFTIFFYLFNKSLAIASFSIIIIYLYKSYLRIYPIYKNLIPDLPLNPILQIMIEDHNPADIFLLIPTIIFIYIRNKITKK